MTERQDGFYKSCELHIHAVFLGGELATMRY